MVSESAQLAPYKRRSCRVKKRVLEAVIRGAPPRNQQLLGVSCSVGSSDSITCSLEEARRLDTIKNSCQGSCQSEGGASGDPVRGEPGVAGQSEARTQQCHHLRRWSAQLSPQILSGSANLVSPRQTAVAACGLQSVRDFTPAVQQPVIPERSGFFRFLGREMEDPSMQRRDQPRLFHP